MSKRLLTTHCYISVIVNKILFYASGETKPVDFKNVRAGYESLRCWWLAREKSGRAAFPSRELGSTSCAATAVRAAARMAIALVGVLSNGKEGEEGSFQPYPSALLGTLPFPLGKGSQLDPQQKHRFQGGLWECQRVGQLLADVLERLKKTKDRISVHFLFLFWVLAGTQVLWENEATWKAQDGYALEQW